MAAPSSNPKKDRIADAMLVALEGISTGGGYFTNAGTNASRRVEPIANVNSFPAVYLITGAAKATPTNIGGSCRKTTAEFVVFAYVNKPGVDTEIIKLEVDVIKALLTDHTQGGLAETTEWVDSEIDIDELVTKNMGIVALTFAVQYQWSLSDL